MNRPSSGFLVIRSFEYLYRHFDKPVTWGRDVYAVPRADRNPETVAKRYRGIDREALEPWSADELEHGYPNIPTPAEREACLWMSDLESRGLVHEDFISTQSDAVEAFRRLRARGDWDMVWAACVDRAHGAAPEDFVLLGYEPTWFWGDHFSALSDSMCFPRWHGTDEAGVLFKDHFQRLNRAALFDSVEDARTFLQFYRSLEWSETGEYVIAEVRGLAAAVA